MRPYSRTRIGLLLVVLIVLVACSNSSLDPTSAPTAIPLTAPTQVPTIAVTPRQTTIWPTAKWQYSTPEDQGLDSVILEQLSQDIRADVPAARSILIVRNGTIVHEDYFKGDESYAGPIWSVTKSIISALIGIALEEGDIGSIEDRLFDYLGAYDTEDINPYFEEITVEHLLNMTAGFSYFPGGASSVPAAFREELVSRPGEQAGYSSTSAHLLSAILQEATGLSALEMANDRIFTPLGIPKPMWSADGYGTSKGGYGLYLTPRDMAKFGYLYLNDGQWDGVQIIPKDWVDTSTNIQAETGIPELSGFADYGYLWWVHPFGNYQAFAAYGAGGQMILVVPESELVVVTTTDSSSTMNLSSKVMQSIIQALADE